MASQGRLIIRRPFREGSKALAAIKKRREVLFRVRFLPKEPGVETYELDILNALFAYHAPYQICFSDFDWDFDVEASKWPGYTPEYLRMCALFAWAKIEAMTQL